MMQGGYRSSDWVRTRDTRDIGQCSEPEGSGLLTRYADCTPSTDSSRYDGCSKK